VGDDAFATVASDITDAKRIEAEKMEALEKAGVASRAKSEFMARMSHEMRTPMNAIMGMTRLAQMKSSGPEKINNCLDKINDASGQLLRLIDDVLDISGMEHDIFKLAASSFSFRTMFQGILKDMVIYADKKQQSIDYAIDQSIPEPLIGDEKRLGQVIANLLANAVKFTPERGEIRFAACALGEDNGVATLQIEVADNGIGISKEQQSEIFTIFEQADGSLSRKYGGIGLGLPLSRRIIEMMGGKIWVDSELGKGSKFTFTCKARTANPATSGTPPEEA
jgi:signal transduction histidine kinase